MASVESSSTLETTTEIPKNSNDNREASVGVNNIQNGSHVVSSVTTTPSQQNPITLLVPTAPATQAVTTANGMVQKNLAVLQNTTKPIPASVFSYRFASPTSNQTPYYVSSDIVLSGGIAQQTRRRIVHNEVERRRKGKINNWILRLASVVPQCSWGKQSKNIVLEKTVDYINDVKTQLMELNDLQQREQKLAQENELLKTRLGTVTEENKQLRGLLKKNDIAIPGNFPSTSNALSTSEAFTSCKAGTPVTVTSEAPKVAEVSTMAASNSLHASSQTVTNYVVPPFTTATTAVMNQLPTTSVAVSCPLREQSRRESVACLAPFTIATNPISLTTTTTSVVSPISSTSVVQALPTSVNGQNSGHNLYQPLIGQGTTSSVVQHSPSIPTQPGLNQIQGNLSSLPNPNPISNDPVTQFATNLGYPLTQQALQTVSTSSQVLQPQAGYSQHSVAAIMKVALQPGTSVSPISVVNAVPLGTTASGQNTSAILNLQPAVINSTTAVPSTIVVPSSVPMALPVSSNLVTAHTGIVNNVESQTSSLPTFYVTAAPSQSAAVAKVNSLGNVSRLKTSSDTSKGQTGNKTKKSGPANKNSKKSTTSGRTQNATRNSQSKAPSSGSKTGPFTNKRGTRHLTDSNEVPLAKRNNTCGSQESQGNMSICQPQQEIMTIHTFNVNALIPGIASQASSPTSTIATVVHNRTDCGGIGKTTNQVSNLGMSQSAQVPRLSHSIASLAGLPRSMGLSQSSSDLQQHQQVSQLGSAGSLSFSAESLLASSEVVLPNIPHITTTSVNSENNPSQPSSLNMAMASSMHSTPNDQTHSQGFSNYSAETLIGGNDLMSDSVMSQESQLQTRPSRTTYSDFSAESLIGSSDLNSGLSYAIDNLISSRSDANYNSTTMVSVNPNLLHSVKANVGQETGANHLRTMANMADLGEQKTTLCSSQPTVMFNNPMSNSSYGMAPTNSTPQFTYVHNSSQRRLTDTVTPQHQTVNATNNVSVASSTSFLKHSVDSITSSLYAVSNAGSSFSLGSNSVSGNSFLGPASFGVDSLTGNQLSFGSLPNPFSPTRPFFNHSSTMGSFV